VTTGLTWTLIRFLHVGGLIFFVGGQLALAVAVVPAVRRHGADGAMRAIARRFGVASVVALVVVIATGAAMASRSDLWGASVLHAKLAVLVLVGVLMALHVATPESRSVSWATLAASLVVVWLGVRLTHG
jgi:uncharacterized membrane protein